MVLGSTWLSAVTQEVPQPRRKPAKALARESQAGDRTGQARMGSAPGWRRQIGRAALLASEPRQVWHRRLPRYTHFPSKPDLVVLCVSWQLLHTSKYFYCCPLPAASPTRATDDGAKNPRLISF